MWHSKSDFSWAVEGREFLKQSDNEKLPRLSKFLILPVNKATPSLSYLLMRYTDMILLDWCYTKTQCRTSFLVNRHFLWKNLCRKQLNFFLLFTVPFLLHQTTSCPSFLGLCCFFLAFHHLLSLLCLPSLRQLLCIHHWPSPLPATPQSPVDVSQYLRTAQLPKYPLF